MAKAHPKFTLHLPRKQTVKLTMEEAEDVMVQLLRIFGPPPPVLVPVLVPMQQTGQIQAQYTGQMPFQLADQITGRN